MTAPVNSRAVMAQRREPPDSLDFFPTPPWATRAFCEIAKARDWTHWRMSVLDPCAGERHMSAVLEEYFGCVVESDVHDYGVTPVVASYVGSGLDCLAPMKPDWVICNPPFNLAMEFVERAIGEAVHGVAVLLRSVWLEGVDRHSRIFGFRPPSHVLHYVERVPMTKGRWDPDASSATSYSWFIWRGHALAAQPRSNDPFLSYEGGWIPPGARQRFTRPDDRARFAAWSMSDTGSLL